MNFVEKPYRPYFSIVIPTCNREHSLSQAIRSILDLRTETLDLSCEVLIVDNSPSEATKALVEKFVPKAAFPVRYIPEPTRGVSFARNAGIAMSAGEYIAFVADDCLVQPDWLQNIATAFARYGCDIVQGKVLLSFEDPEIPSWVDEVDLANVAFYDPGSEVMDADTIMTGNACFRRSVFETSGLFDVRFGGGASGAAEDVEYARRISDKDVQLLYVPDLIVNRLIHRERLTKEALLDRYKKAGYSLAIIESDYGDPDLRLLGLQWKILSRSLKRFCYGLLGNEAKEFKQQKRIAFYRGKMEAQKIIASRGGTSGD